MNGLRRLKHGTFEHHTLFQVWVDEVYMLSPLLARYAIITNDDKFLMDSIFQILKVREHTKDI